MPADPTARGRAALAGGLLVLSLSLALAACGAGTEPGPRWIRLAAGWRPEPVAPGSSLGEVGGSELWLTPVQEGAALGLWVRAEIPAEAWRPHLRSGIWWAPRPLPGRGTPPDGSPPQRLEAGGRAYLRLHSAKGFPPEEPGTVEGPAFCVLHGAVIALPEDPSEPPGTAVLHEYVDLGRPDGPDPLRAAWRLRLGPATADALPVLPGSRTELVHDLPPGSALRFGTIARGTDDPSDGARSVRLRVLLDGAVVFEEELEAGAEAVGGRHVVALPPEGRRGARLAFEALGEPALCAFLEPVVGPAEVGSYDARPWDDPRPHVVVFLADTFRADNLASYGGDPQLTPFLNRFASGALRFARFWATSTWTLPSHGTMFSGLHPYQSGVVGEGDRLADEAVTIAEVMRDAGYRTGAVTDRGFVSERYGLAQGFEWFEEAWEDLDRTHEEVRAFLERDDGRPVFLFVQTYETHVPYTVSAETRARLGEHLGLTDELVFEDLGRLDEVPPALDPQAPLPEELRSLVEGIVALYRGTAADLDRGFESIHAELERRGLLRAGVLVFTSDHGEGLFENGHTGHGLHLFEGNLRVPLLLAGRGIEPGVVLHAATHVDLPRTLAALAGLPAPPQWGGEDLLALATDRPALAWQCRHDGSPSSVALVAGTTKLVAPADPEAILAGTVEHAFDLGVDPEERRDLPQAPWAARTLHGLAPLVLPTLSPILSPARAELSDEELEDLRALGYLDSSHPGD